MAITDYIGRTVDLSIFQGSRPEGDVLLDQSLVGDTDSGAAITGINKLAQRFLIRLLTEKGSIPYLPNEGSEFMYEARTGHFQVVSDVYAAFSASVVDIRRSFLAEEITGEPADEQFEKAELLNVTLSGGEASVLIKLTSRAGTSREYIAPLLTPVRGLS
jgi:hypothetical protein